MSGQDYLKPDEFNLKNPDKALPAANNNQNPGIIINEANLGSKEQPQPPKFDEHFNEFNSESKPTTQPLPNNNNNPLFKILKGGLLFLVPTKPEDYIILIIIIICIVILFIKIKRR